MVGITEEEGVLLAHPDGTFGELEPLGHLEQLGVGRHDVVDRGIISLDVHVDFMRFDHDRRFAACEKVEFRLAHVDVIGRGIGNRAVHAEDGNVHLLTGRYVAADQYPVGGIPARHDRAAFLPKGTVELPIHPHLRIVVQTGFEPNARARGVEIAHLLRDPECQAIPIEGHPTSAPSFAQRGRRNRRPLRIVKVSNARVRHNIVGADRRAGRLSVSVGSAKRGLNDPGVAVPPGGFRQVCPRFGGQIYGRGRLAGGRGGRVCRGQGSQHCEDTQPGGECAGVADALHEECAHAYRPCVVAVFCSAPAPAIAISSSCWALAAPLTPMAPTTVLPNMIGTPP